MLLSLHVENYALIDKLDLSFNNGLTVITGETGAGKSILLGALGLVLGQRADSKVILENKDKCISEAVFDVHAYDLRAFFEENDLEFDPELCVVRRELYSNGKSRAFVNDSPTSLAIIKELSNKLLDIHSQHQNLLLTTEAFPLEVVDALGGTASSLENFRHTFRRMKALQSELKRQEAAYKKAGEEEAFIRFQFDQLDAADLKEGEQEELEEEQQMLAHAEEIKLGLGNLFSLLDNDDTGIVPSLKLALSQSETLKPLFQKLNDATDRLKSAYIDLKDLTRDVEGLFNDVDVNPVRLNQVDERLNKLFTLQQKHKVRSTQELLSLRDSLNEQLQTLLSGDEHILELRKQLDSCEQEMLALATKLSLARKAVFTEIESDLKAMMAPLGMPKAAFKVDCKLKEPDETGQDTIGFLFSSVGSTGLQPIQRIASGGEISRIMLCIKSLIAEKTALPTLLFDEIDTGISGEIAHKMGEIMRRMSSKRQILCITHLPQIAAQGNQHLKVYKTEVGGNVQTTVCPLDTDQRLKEIASMLSGANLTEAALHNAQTLLLENQ